MADHPENEDARGFAGAVLVAVGQYDEALSILQALPEDAYRLHGIAVCCIKLGRHAQARDYLRRAIEINPDDIAARRMQLLVEPPSARALARARPAMWAAAQNSLRAGDLVQGFKLLAENVEVSERDTGELSVEVPRWRGQMVDRLLVIGSGGDGDTLQFCRYLEDAAKRCNRLTVAARPPLLKLIARAGYRVAGLYGITDLLRDADAQIEMMALPSLVGATYGQTSGYLLADAPRDFGPGFHVGINWVASEDTGVDRTVPVDRLGPLADVPGVSFHCLTFGERGKEAPAWIKPLQLGDYADTADTMAGLDLVISVDSSPAHLAGGLDVVDIADFSRLMNVSARGFLDRYFTESELAAVGDGANQVEKLASRFAIKEAVLKALGVGWGDGIAFTDVEVVTLGSGAPTIQLHRQLVALEKEREIIGWLVSASHTSLVAVASVVAISA